MSTANELESILPHKVHREFTSNIRLPAALAGFSLLAWIIHIIRVITGPELKVMDWLYDDCFYYIITAWHFSLQGISSFDGVTRTTGYHPLWMWVCASVVRLHPTLDLTLVRLCMTVCASISIVLACGFYSWALRRNDSGLLCALAVGCSSYSAWNNGLTVMEWPLVVMCWVGLHVLLTRLASSQRCSAVTGTAAFTLGILITLSRTDSGLIVASYVVAAFFLSRHSQKTAALVASVMAFIGCLAGLAISLVYNFRMTGTWLQKSAEIKRLFAQMTTPYNPLPAVWQFSRVLLFLPRLELGPAELQRALHLAIVPAALTASIAVVFLARMVKPAIRSFHLLTPGEQLAVGAAVLAIPSYVLLYGLSAMAMYGWYTAPVTGFILLLTSVVFRHIPHKIALCIVSGLLLLNGVGLWLSGGNGITQVLEVDTGRYMRDHYPREVLSGGDVGKTSFYNRGVMINTDGLMNNEVVPYLREGKIHCYLLRRHVQHISGLGSITIMLEPLIRSRLGMPPLDWSRVATVEVHPYDGREAVVYKVNPTYIRATGECGTEDDQSPTTHHIGENGR